MNGAHVVHYRRVLTGGQRVDRDVAGCTAWRAGLFWPAVIAAPMGAPDPHGDDGSSVVVDRGTLVPWDQLDAAGAQLLEALPDVFARIATAANLS